ncbi:MAG: nucleotidyltransferase domain-containing protein [Bacilli bacterium]|nr:nucleotidyltransferase domain-containing protein [Bacilli bacterium]
MNELRNKRQEIGLTQVEAAKVLGISRRTYQTYEENDAKNEIYNELLTKLNEIGVLDNINAVLSVRYIKTKTKEILDKYPEIQCAYLFGSYARNKATGKSDIDILLVADEMGMKLFGVSTCLGEVLHKNIDIHTHRQLLNNEVLLKELLNEGIKIYG